MKKLLVNLAVILAFAWPLMASAHLIPEKKGTVNVVGNNAYMVITVPVSALTGFDNDHDQKITPAELGAHEEALLSQINEKFKIVDDKLTPIDSATWLMTPNTADEEGLPSSYLVVMQSLAFASPPEHLKIEYGLFGTTTAERLLTITATNRDDRELIILSPDRRESRMFRSKAELFSDFVRIGSVHILGGYDHLAFLLTIIAAGAGFRYWASVITSFTVAHSITLALSLWGVVSLPSSIVEPLILASIVVMGIDAILKRDRPLWARAGLVFACGLVHGLGFASAIGTMGIDQKHKLLSLAGFNIGIELGQALFVSLVLGLILIARPFFRSHFRRRAA